MRRIGSFGKQCPRRESRSASREASTWLWARYRDEKFDAIFADARLPGLTRWELTRVARGSKFNSLVPLILLTNYDRTDPSKSKDVTLMVKPSKAASLIPFLKGLKHKLMATVANSDVCRTSRR